VQVIVFCTEKQT